MGILRRPIQRPAAPVGPELPRIGLPKPPRPNVDKSTLNEFPPTPPRTNRALTIPGMGKDVINLTGLYEAAPTDATLFPPFTLQINQVGRLLVGWVSQTPRFYDPVALSIRSVAPVLSLPQQPTQCGFWTLTSWDATWASPDPKGVISIDIELAKHPPAAEGLNIYDPLVSSFGSGLRGLLRVEKRSDPTYLGVTPANTIYIEPSWQVTGICLDARQKTRYFDAVQRRSTKPRLPYAFVNSATPPSGSDVAVLRDQLVATQIEPLPDRHLLELLEILTKFAVPGAKGLETSPKDPKAEVALARWLGSPPVPRSREEVLRFLNEFATGVRNLRHNYHRDTVRSAFVQNAVFAMRGNETYYQLYSRAIVDEVGSELNIPLGSLAYPIVESGMFPDLVTTGTYSFRYTLSFREILDSGPLKDLLSTVAAWVKLIPAMVGFATLDVKCEKVELKRDADGKVLYDPITKTPLVSQVIPNFGYDSSTGSKVKYTVLILSVGLSPRIPGEVETFSLLGDIQYSDFAKGRLVFGWGQPIGNISTPYASLSTPEIGALEITLPKRHNLTLAGGSAKLITIKNNVREKVESFAKGSNLERADMAKDKVKDVVTKGPHEAAEGWLDDLRMKGFRSKLTGILKEGTISVGVGYVLELTRRPDVSLPAPAYNVAEVSSISIDPSAEIIAFFERDKSNIDAIIQKSPFEAAQDGASRLANFGDPLLCRILVEFHIAKYLALIANPKANIVLDGHASPEGPGDASESEKYNWSLSRDRVEAVYQAIFDAMRPYYPDTAWADVDLRAHGEVEARSTAASGGHLADPPDTRHVATFKQWAVKNKEVVKTEWPKWRRVDITIDGVVSIQIRD